MWWRLIVMGSLLLWFIVWEMTASCGVLKYSLLNMHKKIKYVLFAYRCLRDDNRWWWLIVVTSSSVWFQAWEMTASCGVLKYSLNTHKKIKYVPFAYRRCRRQATSGDRLWRVFIAMKMCAMEDSEGLGRLVVVGIL
jgi:hypothetical protein